MRAIQFVSAGNGSPGPFAKAQGRVMTELGGEGISADDKGTVCSVQVRQKMIVK
jgi:hypothetical protein